MKMARCIQELERIKGIRQGSAGKVALDGDNLALKTQSDLANQDNLDLANQSDLANEINISQQQLGDYKKLLKLIPELQQMIENGSMKATVGYKIWSKMVSGNNFPHQINSLLYLVVDYLNHHYILYLSTETKLHSTRNNDSASLSRPVNWY